MNRLVDDMIVGVASYQLPTPTRHVTYVVCGVLLLPIAEMTLTMVAVLTAAVNSTEVKDDTKVAGGVKP